MKHLVKLLLIVGLVWTSACKKSDGPVDNEGILGTLVRVNCGVSTLGDLWIKGDDGTYYQPCVQDYTTLIAEYYQEGDRVRFIKRKLKEGESCQPICGTILLDGKTEEIGLVWMSLLSKREQFTLKGKLENLTGKLDGCGWVFHSEQGKTYEVLQWYSSAPKIENKELEVTLQPINTFSVCMRGTPAVFLSATYSNGSTTCKASQLSMELPEEKQTVTILSVWQDQNKLKMMLGFSGCDFDPEPIQLHTTNINHSSDPPIVRACLANMPAEQMCQAYFEKEVCFDLTELKKQGSSFTILLKGYHTAIPIQ